MVFGISCAPEMFQKVIEQILSDCPNAINFIDDIIVVGKTEEEHDKGLQSVLKKVVRLWYSFEPIKMRIQAFRNRFFGASLQ